MVKGEVHHLLRSDYARERVILVVLTPTQRAKLVILKRSEFEENLESKVCRTSEVLALPHWLSVHGSLDAINSLMFESAIQADKANAATNGARIAEERQNHILDAVHNVDAILSERDPNVALNRYARACEPPQNETRFRTWFYTYLVFGQNVAALYPAFHNRGRYDRADPKYKTPFGAPGAAGAHVRSKMTTREQAQKILDAFDKHAGLRKTYDKVYDEALRKEYGCHVQDIDGQAIHYHPDGKPYPTYHQFWYRCEKERGGRIGIKKVMRGEETVRNKDLPSLGQYSMGSGNIFERVHLDVEHSEETPQPYLGTTPKPSISICIVRDALSGMALGIGCGNGVEDAQIYREALFCTAIPKDLFGRLTGLPMEKYEWPCEGLPTWAITDRGPGGREALLNRIQMAGIARTLTPTQSPQSNSTAESRNSRRAKIAGIPVEEIGSLTTIGLMQKAIQLLITANRSSSARDRASNAQIMRGEVTPLAIHLDMQRRGRSDARYVSVEDAVRMFLKPIELIYRDGLLYLHNRPFGGAAWREYLEAYPRGISGMLKGYALTLATRHIWVELGHKLVMIDALTHYRDGDHELYLSLDELAEVGRTFAKVETARRNRKPAEHGLAEIRFNEKTGKSMEVKTVRRSSRTKPSNEENEILKP